MSGCLLKTLILLQARASGGSCRAQAAAALRCCRSRHSNAAAAQVGISVFPACLIGHSADRVLRVCQVLLLAPVAKAYVWKLCIMNCSALLVYLAVPCV